MYLIFLVSIRNSVLFYILPNISRYIYIGVIEGHVQEMTDRN